ncbi:TIR domain-containing protein [Owenweeksia hongkongensis]|uniref:TIR domain-containing protein n=1 Tax=Owenweeksia hongkongensis TaxID=253245 RepID=UPI003A9097D2
MALFTEQQLVDRFNTNYRMRGFNYYDDPQAKAKEFINESIMEQRLSAYVSSKSYDIFLSHSSSDARHVYGLKLELEDRGYSVYVDWIEDPELDRSHVSKVNAEYLRKRMKQCKSLLYAFSKNAASSTWMPWELGYFDGIKGTVAVLPISKSDDNGFSGNEYLSLYPYIDKAGNVVYVNFSSSNYKKFDDWL